MNYKNLKQHIKSVGYKNARDFCERNGFPEIRHHIRWECLTIAKLVPVMEKLNLPTTYFFDDYQALLAENAYLEGKVASAIEVLGGVAESPQKAEAVKMLTATLGG